MDNVPRLIRSRPARQQPRWDDPALLRRVTDDLAGRPAVVNAADVRFLRGQLAQVAAGEAHVVQAGDCAEDPAECTVGYVARKTGLLDILAGTMKMNTHKPVLRSARIAGHRASTRRTHGKSAWSKKSWLPTSDALAK